MPNDPANDPLDDASIPFENFADAFTKDADTFSDPVTVKEIRETTPATPAESATVAVPPTPPPAPRAEPPRPTAAAPAAVPGAEGPKRYKIKGKEYGLDEIAKDPSLLEDLAITHGKYDHLSQMREADRQKYVESLERLLKTKDEGQPEPAAAADPRELTRLVRQTYTKEAIQNRIEVAELGPEFAEFAELHPTVAAWAFYNNDMISVLGARVAALTQFAGNILDGGQRQQFVAARDAAASALADSDEYFSWLKDDNARADFFDRYLPSVNPDGEAILDPTRLAALAVGYKKDLIIADSKAARERAAADAAASASRRTPAPPRSVRSGGAPPAPVTSGDRETAADADNFAGLAALGRGR